MAALWALLGRSWASLGRSWVGLGAVLGDLGMTGSAFKRREFAVKASQTGRGVWWEGTGRIGFRGRLGGFLKNVPNHLKIKVSELFRVQHYMKK